MARPFWAVSALTLLQRAGGCFAETSSTGQKLRGKSFYDCQKGCNAIEMDPVCSDGITFQSECIAFCQGMIEPTPGKCVSEDFSIVDFLHMNSAIGDDASTNEETSLAVMPKISLELMKKYEDKGFVFVGASHLMSAVSNDQDNVYQEWKDNPENILKSKASVPEPQNFILGERQAMLTSRGDVYLAREAVIDQGRRKMNEQEVGMFEDENIEEKIIGLDTRFRVFDTTAKPYRRIVEINYFGENGGCTGSVVGDNAILTAAHCVYDRRKRSFMPVKDVVPASIGSNGFLLFGRWEFAEALVYDEYKDPDEEDYKNFDVAILIVKSFGRRNIGGTVGVFTLTSIGCEIDEESRIVGFPADKFDNRMYTSGKCDGWSYDCSSDAERMKHQCDTFGGNSGAGIYDSQNRIFAVHTHGGSTWNSGVAFTKKKLQELKKWIESDRGGGGSKIEVDLTESNTSDTPATQKAAEVTTKATTKAGTKEATTEAPTNKVKAAEVSTTTTKSPETTTITSAPSINKSQVLPECCSWDNRSCHSKSPWHYCNFSQRNCERACGGTWLIYVSHSVPLQNRPNQQFPAQSRRFPPYIRPSRRFGE